MSSAVQTLNDISRLFDSLPGIKVLDRRIDDHSAILDIISRDVSSTNLVQSLCEATNVSLEPPVRLHESAVSAETTWHFSLSANAQGFDLIEFGHLQLLGIHLVWHLHRVGKIPTGAANRLLQQWNGARVGA